ncbi:MAG: YggS family pyridoxal phosphate enzyme [Bacteroidales bacterium]|nr:YggS family pyridoxal phosphate enzyme [Bacteroidales bacterium]
MVAAALDSLRAALPSGVELVAVSKFHPVSRLMEAYDAGQRIFAESRPQELASKVPQMPSDIRWHFIGHLQTNKLKLVLPYVDLVQSVDSLHLLEAINAWGVANGRVVDVLLELHLGAEETKQGFTAQEILALLGAEGAVSPTVAGPGPKCRGSRPQVSQVCVFRPTCDANQGHEKKSVADQAFFADLRHMFGIRLRGLMGMATNTDNMDVVEKDFQRIEELFLRILSEHPELEAFNQLSIGMSADWPVAVKHHATMVRIGTDIFGPREY